MQCRCGCGLRKVVESGKVRESGRRQRLMVDGGGQRVRREEHHREGLAVTGTMTSWVLGYRRKMTVTGVNARLEMTMGLLVLGTNNRDLVGEEGVEFAMVGFEGIGS